MRPRLRPSFGLAVAAAGLFLAALDAYVVVTLLPRMLSDVDLPVDRLEAASPIITGFLAGYVVAMPLLGAASDLRGRLPVYLASLAVFGLGSVLTALAGTLAWLVVGRVLQGLGGGALVPLTLALAADLYPAGRRGVVLGLVSGVQEAGSVVGPVWGTAVALLGGWRVAFWLNLPLVLLIGLVLWRSTPTPSASGGGTSPRSGEGASSPDLVGAGLLGLGVGALAVALYPDQPSVRAVNYWWAPLSALAALLLGAYLWRQLRRLEPLIARPLLASPPFWGALLANLLVGGALMVALVDVPIFARGVFNVDQNAAGLLLTAFLVGVPVGAVVGGWGATRSGPRLPAVAGLLLAGGVFLLLAGWGVKEPRARAYVELAVMGLGFGVVIAPLAASALDATRRREHGLVSSLLVAARTVGMLGALAALTAFGLHRFYQLLKPPPDTGSLHDRLQALEANVTSALVAEYHEIFLLAALLCLAAAVIAGLTLGPRRPVHISE
ncbi:MAG TPA: MFS transporter [Candidatus Dormibacteraeota bacterium]